jgi:hypothetical protein
MRIHTQAIAEYRIKGREIMKKYLVTTVLSVLFLCVSGAVARAAEIVYLEGSVQIQSAADKSWKNAEKGMAVNIGDSVRTARHSRVDIALDPEKKNTIRLEEKTLGVLNSATADTIDRLDLAKGRVYSNMEGIKSGLSFEVNTPSAVAGVRGSSYMVYAERDSDEVSAYKDTVYLKSYDVDNKLLGETMLPEGFKTFINRFELPSAFSQISRSEFERSDSITDHVAAHAEGREVERQERQERQEQQQTTEQSVQQTADQNQVIDQVADTKNLQQDNNAKEHLEDFTSPSEYLESGH